jgi:hypothetical protein
MKQLIELGAVRIAAAIQNVYANVDFDVLSLPGGSLIAALLWLYASAARSMRRDHEGVGGDHRKSGSLGVESECTSVVVRSYGGWGAFTGCARTRTNPPTLRRYPCGYSRLAGRRPVGGGAHLTESPSSPG